MRMHMSSQFVSWRHGIVLFMVERWPASVLPVFLEMVNDSVRILLVVLVMLKVRVIMMGEVMRTVGTMGESVRRHMRERSSCEDVVWLWVVLSHVHEVSWERHATHVDNRAVAHTKEWIVSTTMLLRPSSSS